MNKRHINNPERTKRGKHRYSSFFILSSSLLLLLLASCANDPAEGIPAGIPGTNGGNLPQGTFIVDYLPSTDLPATRGVADGERILSLDYLLYERTDDNTYTLKKRTPISDISADTHWPLTRENMTWQQRQELKDTLSTGSKYKVVFVANANQKVWTDFQPMTGIDANDNFDDARLLLPPNGDFQQADGNYTFYYMWTGDIDPATNGYNKNAPAQMQVKLQRMVNKVEIRLEEQVVNGLKEATSVEEYVKGKLDEYFRANYVIDTEGTMSGALYDVVDKYLEGIATNKIGITNEPGPLASNEQKSKYTFQELLKASDSKEKVDGEVIDSENTKESKEAKNKDNDKLETIDVDIVDTTDEKDNEKAKIDEVENSKDSKNQISTTSFTNPINAKETNETTSYSSTAPNLETPEEAKQEINEKQGESKDEDKTKQSSRFKISLNPLSLVAKLLKNKTYRGAIIGTSLLVILVAILVPVSINANKETKELSEDEFNSLKDSFIKEDEFFNDLASLSFTFSQSDQENLNTTIIKLEYEYTFDGSYYSSNLKSYDSKENEPSIYNINFNKEINSYALTTSLDSSVEPVALNDEKAIQMIKETSSSYFKDYLSFNSNFVSSLLEGENIKLSYEQNKKSGDLRVFDKENGLLDIKLDSLGIVTSLRTYDENSKDKPLYSLDIDYLYSK